MNLADHYINLSLLNRKNFRRIYKVIKTPLQLLRFCPCKDTKLSCCCHYQQIYDLSFQLLNFVHFFILFFRCKEEQKSRPNWINKQGSSNLLRTKCCADFIECNRNKSFIHCETAIAEETETMDSTTYNGLGRNLDYTRHEKHHFKKIYRYKNVTNHFIQI